VREPLNGIPYDAASARNRRVAAFAAQVVEAFIHAHDLAQAAKGGSNRVVNLPGITVTVAEMIEAMGKIAGAQARKRVSSNSTRASMRFVKNLAGRFATPRARALGFEADPGASTPVIRDYIADEGVRAR